MNTDSDLPVKEHLVRILGVAPLSDLAGWDARGPTAGGHHSVCALDLLVDLKGQTDILGLWSPAGANVADVPAPEGLHPCMGLDAATWDGLLGPTPFMDPVLALDHRTVPLSPDVVVILGASQEDWNASGIARDRNYVCLERLVSRLFPDDHGGGIVDLETVLARLEPRSSCASHPASLVARVHGAGHLVAALLAAWSVEELTTLGR